MLTQYFGADAGHRAVKLAESCDRSPSRRQIMGFPRPSITCMAV
jgi:hypothetical protein